MLYGMILLPAAMGLFCAFTGDGQRRLRRAVLLTGQIVLLLLALYAALSGRDYASPLWQITETITFSLRLDAVGILFCCLTAFCWLLTIPYAHVYMPHQGGEPRFYAFLFATEAAVMGAALAADFMTLYLFFELTTVLSAPLVLHGQDDGALLGGAKYLYYSVGGAFLALFGMAVLQQHCATLAFVKGGSLLPGHHTPLVLAAVFCAIVGFGAKAGLYPLHNWLPSAHPAAPAPASALLSGIIAKCGVLAILRLLYFVVGPEAIRGTWVQTAALTLTALTIALGSYMGCLERGLKKRLAYSSISQISYVLLGLFLLTERGVMGGMLQLFFHALAKIAIFQAAGAVILLTGNTRIDQFRGLGRRMPLTMACFTVVSLSLVGIPPFGGFWSKWYLATAALSAAPGALGYVIPAVLILSALLTAGYLAQPIIAAFFPGRDCPEALLTPVDEPTAMMTSPVIFAALTGLLGLAPGAVLTLTETLASCLL
ncbi:MAG: proton-conducting membrane transporter [Oscillospiraceae bacterium]|nr:proton-conducting membrane transporter [Oscillospiraceae bacterium]